MKIDSFLKQTFFVFILIQAGITLAMGILGSFYVKGGQTSYLSFFFPFFCAVFCMIPEFIFYSKKEPSIKKLLIQKGIKLMMLEVIVLGIQKLLAPATSLKILVAIGVSVVIIVMLVELISWRFERGESNAMNQKLQDYWESKK